MNFVIKFVMVLLTLLIHKCFECPKSVETWIFSAWIVNEINKDFIINVSDKNRGAVEAEKEDVIQECKGQLYDIKTYLRLPMEEVEMHIAKIWMELLEVVNK